MILRTDNLLAGKLTSLSGGGCLPLCCPALLGACGNHSGEAEHHSGIGLKLFGFIPEAVFTFTPESCSRSSRNTIRNHTGIAFTLPRIPHPFEIQVFEYEPLPRGAYTYEAHINYVPLQEQLHFSSELTAGVTNQFSAGMVLLSADVPGHGVEYAGFRILPHFYAPPSWNLPLNLGFVAEFSFERPLFDENTREVELRGIVEKHIGRLQLDGNLVFGRALHGPGTREGWGLEPSGRITPSLEYYSSLGRFDNFLPVQRQIHLLFPGADWKIRDRLTWSFGVGFGATDAGSRIILKSRFEFEFGRSRARRK